MNQPALDAAACLFWLGASLSLAAGLGAKHPRLLAILGVVCAVVGAAFYRGVLR